MHYYKNLIAPFRLEVLLLEMNVGLNKPIPDHI